MKKILRALGLVLAVTASASAQRWEVSPFYSYLRPFQSGGLGSLQETAKDSHTRLRQGKGFGVRGTWNTKGYYGFELGAAQLKPVFETLVRPTGATADVVRSAKINLRQVFFDGIAYMMPPGERFRPFLTAGAHMQDFGRPAIAEFTDSSGTRNFGVHYGGGIKIMLFKHALIRADFRHYMTGKPYDLKREDSKNSGGRLHSIEGTVGFGIVF